MRTKKFLVDSSLLVVGNFVLACAVSFFIIPNNILSGGVAGVAIALAPLLPFSIQETITGIIVITFLLGFIFLGKKFALKTLASSIIYPVFIGILSNVSVDMTVEPLLASLYGGLFSGVGLGIVFRTGASTGGMDIPPLILTHFTKIKVSIWIMVVDLITILLGMSNYGINSVLIGAISVWSATKAIDFIATLGGEGAKQVLIISNSTMDVLKMILESIDRGATLIDAEGGYTHEKKKLILTVIMTEQYPILERQVKEIDPEAFLIVSAVTEVHGNGFYRI